MIFTIQTLTSCPAILSGFPSHQSDYLDLSPFPHLTFLIFPLFFPFVVFYYSILY